MDVHNRQSPRQTRPRLSSCCQRVKTPTTSPQPDPEPAPAETIIDGWYLQDRIESSSAVRESFAPPYRRVVVVAEF
jgi:hypothetical protein